mmetsp:Transcript_5219/g.4801  ORF Transcript_5219/g.4801 Transcript_5219/m.4801 type:complete len:161 (+) Transcript_5219:1219-1701(+)|eukprot:CAMPEP_0170542396 /NCGR_PEP_ID=MMETSP0211-20121228/1832_1 /TAXON_ID=311385 /ORGANISM="Pseudokeronopsis sp., Strain OXSARD2" /LENGTH=160 /DNA_ID=CAMNT_0010845439 /DNA_START=1211 /DNA_END=1693 /DNA_ORIENTATION=-
MDFASIQEMKRLNLFMNEAMRMAPSVPISSPLCFHNPVKIGDYDILADQGVMICMYGLHHNPEQWIEPFKFIPERFDPSSEYYLTPQGTKRHPLSYSPFLGGKRACLGKTFSEMISKVTIALIIWGFDFKFENNDHYFDKPLVNISGEFSEVMVRLTEMV